MSTTNNFPAHPHPVYTSEELDLRQLLRAIWRYRLVVAVFAVAGAGAGFAFSHFNAKYVADGLFLAPSLTVASLKKYEVGLRNEQRFEDFIAQHGLVGTQSEQLLRKIVEIPEAYAKAIKPAFSFTTKDARAYEIGGSEASGDLLGLTIRLERTVLTDESPILHLAEYVRHTMIMVDLGDVMLGQCMRYQTVEMELRNEQIESDFSTTQARARADVLRDLINRIPGAAEVDNRQVISLEGGGERFLSPTAQLVAAEITIAEANLATEQRARKLKAATLQKGYYCGGLNLHRNATSGRRYIDALTSVQADVFATESTKDDIVEQTANSLNIERQAWISQYLERARFVVPPEGGEALRRVPSLAVAGVMGFLSGCLLGLIAALLLAWWHDNREAVITADE